MNNFIKSPRQRGFSLLEVLVALVILSIGLLAVAALQGRLLRNTSDTKARTTAVSIAQGQIDKFRGLQAVASSVAADLEFTDIAAGALGDGSTFGDGTDLGATAADASTISVGGTTYTPTWTVTDVYYDKATGDFTTTAPSGTSTAAFKEVAVTVTWPRGELDADDAEILDSVTLTERIAAVSPSDSARALDEKGESPQPIVYYTPQPAPEVVSVPVLGLGGDRFKETSKPEPDVLQREVNTVTTFSTITFDEIGDNTFQALRREDTFVVNCVCEFDNSSGAVGRAPTVWNGREFVIGEEVEGKTVGTLAQSVRGQPDICQTCCRDHHDASDSSIAKYDPFRDADGNGTPDTGPHLHFNVDNDGGFLVADPLGADGAPTEYLEACRFTRVDGDVYVTQDFNLATLNIMPERQLSSASGLSAYQTYVTSFVTEYMDAVATLKASGAYPATLPDISQFSATFTPSSVSSSDLASGIQFLARGIYVDHISNELLECINIRRGNTTPAEDTPVECLPAVDDQGVAIDDGGFLDIVPFNEINVTRLANWKFAGDARVTTEAITDGDEDTYSRGFATLMTGGGNAETSTVTAAIELSNTGLTDTRTIDPDDGDVQSSGITLTNDPPSDKVIIAGDFSLGRDVSAVAPSDIQLTGTGDWACQVVLASRKQDPNTFTCSNDRANVEAEAVDGAGSMALRIANYSEVYSDRQGNQTLTCIEDNSVTLTPTTPTTATVTATGNNATSTEFSDATIGNLVLPAEAGDVTFDVDITISNVSVTCS